MELITCSNGHTYDSSITPECPECAGHTVPLDTPAFFDGAEDIGKTVPIHHDTQPINPPTGHWADPGANYGGPVNGGDGMMTTPVSFDKGGVYEQAQQPVTGWLVCIDGPEIGRDYRLHEEYNYIGRNANMDVAIPGDSTISRERHAIIAYDPQDRRFYFSPATGASIVRHNGKTVMTPVELVAGDRLQIGKCTFLFVPLCGDNFQW